MEAVVSIGSVNRHRAQLCWSLKHAVMPAHLPPLAPTRPYPCPLPAAPTVGWACINLHKLYRRPRGMYFSANDRGEMVRGWGAIA